MIKSQGSQILLQNLLQMAEHKGNTIEYTLEQYCVLLLQLSEIPLGSNVSISICVHVFLFGTITFYLKTLYNITKMSPLTWTHRCWVCSHSCRLH